MWYLKYGHSLVYYKQNSQQFLNVQQSSENVRLFVILNRQVAAQHTLYETNRLQQMHIYCKFDLQRP